MEKYLEVRVETLSDPASSLFYGIMIVVDITISIGLSNRKVSNNVNAKLKHILLITLNANIIETNDNNSQF